MIDFGDLLTYSSGVEWLLDDKVPLIEKTITVAVIGWLGGVIGGIVDKAYLWLNNKMISTLHLDSTSDAYEMFSAWYMRHYAAKGNRMEASVKHHHDDQGGFFKLAFFQLDDVNIIKYKGKWVLVEKHRDILDGSIDKYNRYLDTYFLKTLSGGDVLTDMVQEAYDEWGPFNEDQKGVKAIITDEWAHGMVINIPWAKSLKNVFVEGKSDLLKDIQNFLSQRPRYDRIETVFKRAYLLHGKPGSGKTSLVFAVAKELNRPIYYLNPSSFRGDSSFESFVSQVKPKSIILIEDIDVFWTNRDADAKVPVSFQSLLNVLDGLHSPNDVLIFMTTNKKDDFDEAFIRKGRIDYMMEVSYPSKEAVRAFVSNFYQKEVDVPTHRAEGSYPMSEVQDICLTSPSSEEAIKKILAI